MPGTPSREQCIQNLINEGLRSDVNLERSFIRDNAKLLPKNITELNQFLKKTDSLMTINYKDLLYFWRLPKIIKAHRIRKKKIKSFQVLVLAGISNAYKTDNQSMQLEHLNFNFGSHTLSSKEYESTLYQLKQISHEHKNKQMQNFIMECLLRDKDAKNTKDVDKYIREQATTVQMKIDLMNKIIDSNIDNRSLFWSLYKEIHEEDTGRQLIERKSLSKIIGFTEIIDADDLHKWFKSVRYSSHGITVGESEDTYCNFVLDIINDIIDLNKDIPFQLIQQIDAVYTNKEVCKDHRKEVTKEIIEKLLKKEYRLSNFLNKTGLQKHFQDDTMQEFWYENNNLLYDVYRSGYCNIYSKLPKNFRALRVSDSPHYFETYLDYIQNYIRINQEDYIAFRHWNNVQDNTTCLKKYLDPETINKEEHKKKFIVFAKIMYCLDENSNENNNAKKPYFRTEELNKMLNDNYKKANTENRKSIESLVTELKDNSSSFNEKITASLDKLLNNFLDLKKQEEESQARKEAEAKARRDTEKNTNPNRKSAQDSKINLVTSQLDHGDIDLAIIALNSMPDSMYKGQKCFSFLDSILMHPKADEKFIISVLKKVISCKDPNSAFITHRSEQYDKFNEENALRIIMQIKSSEGAARDEYLNPLADIYANDLLKLRINHIRATHRLDEKRKIMIAKKQLGEGVSGGGTKEEYEDAIDAWMNAKIDVKKDIAKYKEQTEYIEILKAYGKDENTEPQDLQVDIEKEIKEREKATSYARERAEERERARATEEAEAKARKEAEAKAEAKAKEESEAKAKEEARIKEQEEAKAKEVEKRMKKIRPSLHAQIRNTLGFEDIDKDHKHHNRVIALLSEGHIDKAIIAFSNISHKFYNDGKYNSEADTCKEKVMSYQNLSSEFGLALRQKFHISHQSLMDSIINDDVYEALNVIRLMPNDFYALDKNFDKQDEILSHRNIDPNIIKEVLKKTLSDKVTNPQLIRHLGDKLPHLDTPVHKSILKVSRDYSNNSDLKPLVVISSKHLLELGITNIKNTYKLDEKRKAMREKQQLGHGVSGGGDPEEAAKTRDEFWQARDAQKKALITYGESSEYETIIKAVNLFIPDTDESTDPQNLLEHILEIEQKLRNEGGHSPSK